MMLPGKTRVSGLQSDGVADDVVLALRHRPVKGRGDGPSVHHVLAHRVERAQHPGKGQVEHCNGAIGEHVAVTDLHQRLVRPLINVDVAGSKHVGADVGTDRLDKRPVGQSRCGGWPTDEELVDAFPGDGKLLPLEYSA